MLRQRSVCAGRTLIQGCHCLPCARIRFFGCAASDRAGARPYQSQRYRLIKSARTSHLAGVAGFRRDDLRRNGDLIRAARKPQKRRSIRQAGNTMKMTIRWKRFASCVLLLSLTWTLCLRSSDIGWTRDKIGDAVGASAQAEISLDLREIMETQLLTP